MRAVFKKVSEAAAKRFAKYVLEEHRASGTFEIEVIDFETKQVAEALESLGCKVTIDSFRPRLNVVSPEVVA